MRALGYPSSTDRYVPYNVTINPRFPEATSGHYVANRRYNVSQAPTAEAKSFYNGDFSNWTLSEAGLLVVPSRCIYQISTLVENSRRVFWFPNYFAGELNSDEHAAEVYDPIVPRSVYMIGKNYSTPADRLQSLEAINSMMQNITDSMTTYIRWHGNINISEPAQGEVHRYAVCIAVRWGYIAYSGGIVFSLLIFLPMMIINTRSAGSRDEQHGDSFNLPQQHDFKSSTLAVLFHGLETQDKDQHGKSGTRNTSRELEEESKTVMVQMVMTRNGWKLANID